MSGSFLVNDLLAIARKLGRAIEAEPIIFAAHWTAAHQMRTKPVVGATIAYRLSTTFAETTLFGESSTAPTESMLGALT